MNTQLSGRGVLFAYFVKCPESALALWRDILAAITTALYSRRLSQLESGCCCGFFGLFGRVLKVVLPDVSPVSVADIFGNH